MDVKRVIIISLICMAGLAAVVFGDLSFKTATQYESHILKLPLDTAGLPQTPDSFQIVVGCDTCATPTYIGRATSSFSAIGIDSITEYGKLHWRFRRLISDIDSNKGNVQLNIEIQSFTRGLPTQTAWDVLIINHPIVALIDSIFGSPTVDDIGKSAGHFATDSLNARGAVGIKSGGIPVGAYATGAITADAIAASAIGVSECPSLTLIIDSVNASLDSLQLQDDWIITRFVANRDTAHAIHVEVDNVAGFNFTSDSVRSKSRVYAIADNAISATAVAAAAIMKFWNIPFDTTHTAGSLFDSLCNASYVQGAAGSSVWSEAQRDSVLHAVIEAGFRAKIQATLDSMIAKFASRKSFDWLTDTVKINTSLLATAAGVDSITIMVNDYTILAGFKVGTRFITHAHPDADTTWAYEGATLKGVIVVRHIGRTAAAYPDSGKVVGP